MSSARKIIGWQGRAPAALARALADLANGQYARVPESDIDDEQVDGLIAALERAERDLDACLARPRVSLRV